MHAEILAGINRITVAGTTLPDDGTGGSDNGMRRIAGSGYTYRGNFSLRESIMNKGDFVGAVADAAELSKADAGRAVDAMIETIKKAASAHSRFASAPLVRAAIRRPAPPSRSRLPRIRHSRLAKPLRMP